MMGRKYSLYSITGEREDRLFYDNIRSIAD